MGIGLFSPLRTAKWLLESEAPEAVLVVEPGIRKEPNIGAKRTGEDLLPGECFEIKKEADDRDLFMTALTVGRYFPTGCKVRRAGRRYFELLDGRGWVFDWCCSHELAANVVLHGAARAACAGQDRD